MNFELLWENYALRSFESSCSLHEQFSDEARAHTKLEFLQREFRSLDCEKCFWNFLAQLECNREFELQMDWRAGHCPRNPENLVQGVSKANRKMLGIKLQTLRSRVRSPDVGASMNLVDRRRLTETSRWQVTKFPNFLTLAYREQFQRS